MTLVENLALAHNIYYAILPIVFWIYVFAYTKIMACEKKRTSLVMLMLILVIVFMMFDMIYCSILLSEPTFKNDPNYNTIKISIIASLVVSVIGVFVSFIIFSQIFNATYCLTPAEAAGRARARRGREAVKAWAAAEAAQKAAEKK
uniref:Uncharacterized protein n=1 Tax=viral metagenome TaxID=1070528 RepID=A0A6C0K5H8_9ZZZZ